MPSHLTRILLFLSSYAPLLTILAVRHWEFQAAAVILLSLALLSVVWLLVFVRAAMELAPTTIEVSRASPRDGDVVSYIVSYLLPFLGIDFSKLEDVLSLVILFVVIALLYVHSNLIYVNPLLAGLGYHLIEIEEVNGKISILLSKRPYVRPGVRLRVIPAGNLINLEAADEQ